jgi:hypothetical protein
VKRLDAEPGGPFGDGIHDPHHVTPSPEKPRGTAVLSEIAQRGANAQPSIPADKRRSCSASR